MTLDNRGRTGDSPESTGGGPAKVTPAPNTNTTNAINAATLGGTPSATNAAAPATGHNTSPASSSSPASPPFASAGSASTTNNTSTPPSTNVSGSSGSGGDAHNKSSPSSFTDLSTSSPPPPPPAQPPSSAAHIAGAGGPPSAISQQSMDELIDGFPEAKLRSLTTKISNSRWVVPVLPTQELECLLNYAIRLTQAGCDHDCEPCVRFYRESLYISFVKILTDEAVTSWKFNIQYCILNTCGKLLQLCALHMSRDNAHLLDLLAIVLDPDNKFNTFNISRMADQYVSGGPGSGSPNNSSGTTASGSGSPGSPVLGAGPWGLLDEASTYARSPAEPRSPRGWLVDLLNRFGQFGGFDNLLERFNAGMALLNRAATEAADAAAAAEDHGRFGRKVSATSSPPSGGTDMSSSTAAGAVPVTTTKITLQLIHSLLRPFGQCYELLTVPTIERYFMPIWEVVLNLMDGMSDEDLKREAKPEGRSDSINGIVKAARALASRLENQDNLIRELEMFRLKMVLRLLKVSGFTGKMNALNEINKMLSSVKYSPHRTQMGGGGGGGNGGGGPGQGGGGGLGLDDDMDWLTADRMAVSVTMQLFAKEI